MHSFFSPAKINFFFHVIGKRLDGYHQIASLLHTVSFGDYLTFTPSDTDQFTIERNEKVPRDNSNLIIQALELFRNKTGWEQPLHIHLQKNIPIGSGLGGGSSNAATTLWALNAISRLEIPKDELQKWSANLGSDVPFFFSNGCAVCTGRGEIVEDKPAIYEREIYLILNDQNVNTGIVFSHVIPPKEPVDISKLIADTLEKKYPCINELEEPAFKAYPSLCSRKKDISDHFVGSVFMTGSGGSFVGIGRPGKELLSRYPVMKKVECIEILYKDWYTDRKLVMSELESKITTLKNTLPKEMSVVSIPGISRCAYVLYIAYLYKISEEAESIPNNFLNNRENCCESAVRNIKEVYGQIKLLMCHLEKSIKLKTVDQKCKLFIKQALYGTKYDQDNSIKPNNAMEGIREAEKTSSVVTSLNYGFSSEFVHCNVISIIEYFSPIDSNTETIYFGRNNECNIEGIIELLKILDELINSFDSNMKLLEDFKSLCVEKEQANIEL